MNRSGANIGRWPVYSKFFDNMGPIPHHMHQSEEHARLVGQEGKPESYYFPPQHNTVGNNFPYTFMGFEPGTTKEEVKALSGELEQRRQRNSGFVESVSSETWERMADRSWNSACAGFALHL